MPVNDPAPVPMMDSLIAPFEAQARRTPHAIALIDGGRSQARRDLTYGDLEARANRLARLLRRRGLRPGDLVAVSLDRSVELFVALFGILKAGGAFVPVESKLPPVRRLEIVTDAGAATLVTTHEAFTLEGFSGQTLVLSQLGADLAREDPGPLSADAAAGHASDGVCCVLYTSGVTGRPKGVIVPDAAILDHLCWMWEAHPFQPGDVALLHRSYMHMAAMWDYFGFILQGVPSVLVPGDQTADPAAVLRQAVAHGVTHASGSPSFWQAMLDLSPHRLEQWQTLRLATTSGEQVSIGLVNAWKRAFPRGRLLNVYGLTEAVRPAACDTTGVPHDAPRVPIGPARPTVGVYIVDDARTPVPPGDLGEVCVAGPCVARGYHRLPELTASRFVANPFESGPRATMFMTGDIGRLRPDGQLEIVGRRDHQVKIRGCRVELADVEAALQQVPSVRQAAVIVQDDPTGGNRLVACIVPEAGSAPAGTEIRTALEARLPDYMLPSRFVLLDRLPLTASGKIDRSALAAQAGQAAGPTPPLVSLLVSPLVPSLGQEPAPAFASATMSAMSSAQGESESVIETGRERERERESERAPATAPAPAQSETPVEQALAPIWCEIMGVAAVRHADRFLELGGHSLMAMQIVSRIYDRFEVDLPLETFFSNPTLATVAATVESLLREQAAASASTPAS